VRRQGSGVFNEQKDDAKVESDAESLTVSHIIYISLAKLAKTVFKDAPTKEEVPAIKLVVQTGAEDIRATSEVFPSTQDPE